MAKMNRRDYLIRMGAGAGAVLGANDIGLLAGERLNSLSRGASEEHPEHNTSELVPAGIASKPWPVTPNEPSACAAVTLIFDGLMGFFYNENTKECEIGMHPGGGMHKPDIHVWEKPADQCYEVPCKKIFSLSPLSDQVKLMTLRVEGRPRVVDFFNKDPFDRLNGDRKDFRWLLDLDGPDFYPDTDTKKNVFTPILKVNDGTFYTRMRTNSTFMRVDRKRKLSQQTGTPLGHLPLVMAAAINLTGDEYVSFKLMKSETEGFAEINLFPKAGSIYEISFFNRCKTSVCKNPDPYDDGDEEKRNDFHFMRKALSLPLGKIKYTVALQKKADASGANYCGGSLLAASDESPCMGSGYGQGGCTHC